jgi:hypothetical protein
VSIAINQAQAWKMFLRIRGLTLESYAVA